MNVEILVALIAAITSLIISILSYTQNQINTTRLKDEFIKNKRRESTTRLIELRIEHYPKALEITSNITKKKGDNLEQEDIKDALIELNKWRSGIVRLIISNKSQTALFDLLAAMKKQPANNINYSDEQVKKIWLTRNDFRSSLRRDIGIMHSEDENHIR